MPETSRDWVKRQTVLNLSVLFLSRGFLKILGIVTTIVLARLLTPSDFGVIGVVGLLLGYVSLTSDWGLGSALVRQRERVRDATDVVFTVRPLFAVAQTVVSLLIAPLVAAFFADSRLTDALRVASLVLIIDSFNTVPNAILARELQARKTVAISMTSSVLNAGVTISLALLGFSYWSFIYSDIVASTFGTLAVWSIVRYRPRLMFDRRLARELVSFGNFLVVSSLFWFLFISTDNLLVGRFFGIEALGYYVLAFKFGYYPVSVISQPMENAVFPAFVKLVHDPSILTRAYLKTIRYVSVLSIPFAVALAILSREIIVTFLGLQWLGSVALLQILAWYGLSISLSAGCEPMFLTLGRPRDWTKVMAFRFFAAVPLAFGLASAFGTTGIALGFTIAAALGTVFALEQLKRDFRVSWREHSRTIYRPAVASLLAGALMYGALVVVAGITAGWTTSLTIRSLANLLIAGALGLGAYLVATVWIMKDTTPRDLWNDLMTVRRSRRTGSS